MTSTVSLPRSLPRGCQRPRIDHVPNRSASDRRGKQAVELAALAGLILDDWQEYVLIESMRLDVYGKWAAKTVGLVVGRQNGKNQIILARQLAGLFLLNEQLIIHTAHEQKTASEHFRKMLNLVRAVPKFESRMLKPTAGKGSEAIEMRSGARIFFSTRTGGGGRGLTVDLMTYDEAMHLSNNERSALTPTMAAKSIEGNTQSWYMGSAVDKENPKHDGVPLAQVRLAGMNGADGVAYFEWSASGDDPSDVSEETRSDPNAWAQANPGLGIRISAEWIEHERTVEMGARGFNVERLSIGDWPDPTEEGSRKIPGAMWTAACDDRSKVLDPVWLIFDMPETRETVSIAAVGRREDGEIHGEIIEHDLAPGVAAEKLALLAKKRRPAGVLYDELGPAGRSDMPAALKRLKVRRLRPITTQEFAQACGTFYDVVKGGTFHHTGQPCLDDAVEGAETRPLVDAWAWSRKNSTANAAPLVAVTIGAWAEATLAKPKAGIVDLAAALAQAEAEGR